MEQSREVRLAYANAIVDMLWMKGIISNEEKQKIIKLNEKKIK